MEIPAGVAWAQCHPSALVTNVAISRDQAVHSMPFKARLWALVGLALSETPSNCTVGFGYKGRGDPTSAGLSARMYHDRPWEVPWPHQCVHLAVVFVGC